MTVCKEMQKLRKTLDIMGIEWIDRSEEWQATDYFDLLNIKNYGICRTHFDYNGKHYSVINGYGSFGGYDGFDKENKNLLEIMLPNNDVIGYLTAKEVLEIIEENKNEYVRMGEKRSRNCL